MHGREGSGSPVGVVGAVAPVQYAHVNHAPVVQEDPMAIIRYLQGEGSARAAQQSAAVNEYARIIRGMTRSKPRSKPRSRTRTRSRSVVPNSILDPAVQRVVAKAEEQIAKMNIAEAKAALRAAIARAAAARAMTNE